VCHHVTWLPAVLGDVPAGFSACLRLRAWGQGRPPGARGRVAVLRRAPWLCNQGPPRICWRLPVAGGPSPCPLPALSPLSPRPLDSGEPALPAVSPPYHYPRAARLQQTYMQLLIPHVVRLYRPFRT